MRLPTIAVPEVSTSVQGPFRPRSVFWDTVMETIAALFTPARRDNPSTLRLRDPSWWSV
jgi:hypothetical protein